MYDYESRKFEPLIGKQITAVQVSAGGGYIRFQVDDAWQYWSAEGDCCSHSWVYACDNMPALLGHTVTAVEELDLPTPDQEGYGCLASYGIKITTDAGEATIEYRNESNGYYGGWLEHVDAPGKAQKFKDWDGEPVV